jgi:magnesium chelatase family protein
MDRIDLLCEVNPVPADILTGESASESSRDIRARVENARRIQLERFDGRILTNSQMSTSELRIHCKTGKKETEFLSGAINRLSLSARAFSRILKVARTIADLESSKYISLNHLAEAVVYRGLDRRSRNE